MSLLFPCCCSVSKSCLTLCNPMDCDMPGFPVLHYFLEFAQIHVCWVSDTKYLFLCCPLLLPSIFLNTRVFLNESALLFRWPKCWSFSVSSSNEYSGLISFRIDEFDLLAVQGTLKSVLQNRKHCFFTTQSSWWFLTFVHDYWKN